MRAAILENGAMRVGHLPDPSPEQGQVLVKTHRCALCASDAHFIHSAETIIERSKPSDGPYARIDLSRPIVMGHEYVGEIVDYGPGSRRPLPVGTRVTSVPGVRLGNTFGIVGYYPECPGGYGELMLLDEDLLLSVPEDLDLDLAALIEPLAVGVEHARAGGVQVNDIPLVLGCGAIGLGVIAALKLQGVGPVVACDIHSDRLDMAALMGADVLVDVRVDDPYRPRSDLGGRSPNVIYECAGRPGMLTDIVNRASAFSRIVMGGYCLEPEELYVPTAQNKRLTVHFAGGELPDDMVVARDAIASCQIDLRPWLGEGIGLAEVASTLQTMADPGRAIRYVVDPAR